MQSNINQADRARKTQDCDLAIIGSGISCTYTLLNYVGQLKQQIDADLLHLSEPISVIVFDKSGEFWTGIPYGSRTGQHSLIITALKEFLPEPERDRFTSWLAENYDHVLNSLQQRPGLLTSQWLQSYQKAIANGNWDELFVPRYVFGWYLRETVEQLLAEATREGYLQCDLLEAEVLNLQKQAANYQIKFATEAETKTLDAAKIVLAIGSPPNKLSFVEKLEAAATQSNNDVCFIGNMYEPTQDTNLELVAAALRQSNDLKKQVLIIGSNASALETVYSLNNFSETENLIDKFIVISPNGQFPHRIGDRSTQNDFAPQALAHLTQQSDITAQQISAAVQQDVASALQQGQTVDSTYQVISQKVISCLNKLNFAEQREFVIKYGVEIGKFQRRAGTDYLSVVDELIFQDKLELIKGKFLQTIDLDGGGTGFKFTTADQQTQQVTSPIKVIINCAGFQNLHNSSSPLIGNLIQQKVCVPNDSLCGFEVDENFAANENLYLMGPLVAGNINSRFKIWHAESCGRIINLSQQLAEVLI